ncbi:hypothetical protein G9464_15670 [Halostella sp. JP-L12]|uniref:hypothetical protein n=1 Tax=Halostella TaxID=1843185 RepID=UPI000EF83A14|nr:MULTISPECIES: hypothetical protein [Halostella]NHN49022.1 hypothetical protein [Halostella sp. JP-L12]
MSHRRHTETRAETGQGHPTSARSIEVDDSSTSETREDELAWPFLSPAITDCSECRRGRPTTVSGGTTVRQGGSADAVGGDAATTIESDTGTESVRLEPGTVAALYAAVGPEADLFTVHVHADPAYTVRLRGPDGVVSRTISATGGSGDNVGVVTWTVEAPPRGRWTVEVRAPADASRERVSVTFGTLAGDGAVVPSPGPSE